jgi:hypothetical protein
MTCHQLWFVNNPLWTFDGNVYASWCPKLPLLATSLSQSCSILKPWNVSILILLTSLWTYKTWIGRVNSVVMLWASSCHAWVALLI